jgi:hypothetical protein
LHLYSADTAHPLGAARTAEPSDFAQGFVDRFACLEDGGDVWIDAKMLALLLRGVETVRA